MINELLERVGLKYEDLNKLEAETFNQMLESLSKTSLTIESLKTYIASMKTAVEKDLAKIGHENKQDIYLKARLRNYILLEEFLASPERARTALERSIAGMIPKKKS